MMADAETGDDSRTPARLFALKQGDTFVVADACGNITGEGDGLFHDDTRLLSRFRLSVAGRPLELLGGAVSADNVVFTANLTNRPLPPVGGQPTRQGVIHVERSRLIWEERLHERLRLRNYGPGETRLALRLEFAADFRDMFEVRGLTRTTRGRTRAAVVAEDSVELSYEGLDGLVRLSTLVFGQRPTHLAPGFAEFELSLPPGLRTDLFYEVGLGAAETPSRQRYRTAAARARLAARAARGRGARLETSGRVFSEWLGRSRADLALLTTEFDTGPYPYAGIPWFSTAFGRDAIVTALQMLWLDPSLARGVLRYLARHQATETSRFTDAAPGKIMHETRKGEMARLHELPGAGRWLWRKMRVTSSPQYALLLWPLVVPVLVYLPLNVQRRMAEAVIVPLAILAAVGLRFVIRQPHWKRLYRPAVVVMCLSSVLFLVGITTLYDWRTALISLTAIPLSLVAAIVEDTAFRVARPAMIALRAVVPTHAVAAAALLLLVIVHAISEVFR